METAILARVGEWFIASVNDGAVVLHPLEEIILDVIGALADLKKGGFLALHDFSAKSRRPNRADSPRAGKQNPKCQEGEERKHVLFVKRRFAVERVVFVTAKGRAGVMVHVVADETDFVLQLQSVDRFLEQQVAGAIV